MIATDTHQALTKDQLIQWYRVDRVLGRGGFGVTYLATDNNLDHQVAIKEYLPATLVHRRDDKSVWPVSVEAETPYREGLQRFLAEARTLVKFRHPNIVRVMAVFEANNTAYLVMEYEEGERFKESVSKPGGANEHTLKNRILSIVDGLEQVHQHGFIHRDIKPVNLIIRKDGSPVLLDFGATRVAGGEGDRHTSFVSVGYTPLEQYHEGASLTVGPWTDIYSLGATLYFAISGETPVSAVSRLAALVKKSPDPLVAATEIGHGRYSEAFLEAIDWALQFKIEDRPQNLTQWRRAIQPASITRYGSVGISRAPSATALSARGAERSAPVSDKSRSKTLLTWLAIPLVLVLVVAGVRYIDQRNRLAEFDQLMARADSAFDEGEYLQNARPRYLEVLEVQPENPHANDRLMLINDRLEEDISGLIDNQALDVAEALIQQYAQIEQLRAKPFARALQRKRQENATQARLAEINRLIESGEFDKALSGLSVLRQDGVQHPRMATLASRASTGVSQREAHLQRLDQQREQARINARRRIAEANKRQRQRRKDYQQYLSSARLALQNDNIERARRWLNSAKSLQFNGADLEELENRLKAAENFAQQPLTNYEISYARAQFNALKRAIEVKNSAAINELITPDSSNKRLFETLFERYTQLTVKVLDVETKLDPKRVTAVLRIDKMALPNGDVVYPSASYRDSTMTIERQRYSWSPVQW